MEVRISALEVAGYEFVDETDTTAVEYEIISDKPIVRSAGNHSAICLKESHTSTYPETYGAYPATGQTTPLPSCPTHCHGIRWDTIEHSTPTEAQHASWKDDTSVVPYRADIDGRADRERLGSTTTRKSSDSTDDTGVTVHRGAEALLLMRSHALDSQLTYTSSSISLPSLDSSQGYWDQKSSFASGALPATPGTLTSPAPLSSQEEAWLLRQFSTEVGTWMEISDL
ncbi:hypothetical protein BDV30DRAFT_129030 [Aspergillus minisclerotigenes]|uniref:Uncharacterized protein n=1 Tax=Aspergillus minisclerotigenes TaxID=656917 RepID=A0A5N6J2E8_9EURO|nr:hypothetical protein BDV30DRAFT_129030 [Aspergillus minisclerotigenes]